MNFLHIDSRKLIDINFERVGGILIVSLDFFKIIHVILQVVFSYPLTCLVIFQIFRI
jgi:sensor histidine kinase YesM